MPPKPLEPGDPARLGRFELIARLGEGGQGVVYLGRGTGPAEERVAVKVLRSSVDGTVLQRLGRELDAIHQVQPFVTARVPFGADAVPAVMHRILYEEPDLTGVPPSLLPVILQCLDKDPARRPSARDVLLRLVDPTAQQPQAPRAAAEPGAPAAFLA